MKSPHIAIIVLHYKNLEDSMKCLRSLEKLTYEKRSVFVVNNDNQNHLEQLASSFPFIEPIQNDLNLGFAGGNNAGIKKALEDSRVDAVLLVNNDTELEPDALESMAAEHADMVAPRMMQMDDKNKVDNLGITLYASGLPFNRRTEKEKLLCPSAGCALYSRKLLEDIGMFDERFFAYAEDLDLGLRARLAGYRAAYAPSALVYHKGSATTAKLSEFAVFHTYRNLIWVYWKNIPLLALLWQLPIFCLGWLGLWAGYALKGRPLIIPKAFLSGYVRFLSFTKDRMRVQKKVIVSHKEILSWFTPSLFPRKK